VLYNWHFITQNNAAKIFDNENMTHLKTAHQNLLWVKKARLTEWKKFMLEKSRSENVAAYVKRTQIRRSRIITHKNLWIYSNGEFCPTNELRVIVSSLNILISCCVRKPATSKICFLYSMATKIDRRKLTFFFYQESDRYIISCGT